MAGIRLRDAERGLIPWRDVYVVARFAPEGSPLGIAINPEQRTWDVTQALLAVLVDQLNGLLWQNGGGKSPRPKPIPRPWKSATTDEQVYRGESMSIDDFDAWMADYFDDVDGA